MNSSDILRLIKFVKNNPCLYDPNEDEYKNITLKNRLWKDIAEQINLSEDQVRIKWKNIRDTHTRFKKGKLRQAKYLWAPHITFLNSVNNNRTCPKLKMRRVKIEPNTDSNTRRQILDDNSQYFSDGDDEGNEETGTGNNETTCDMEEQVHFPVQYVEGGSRDKGIEHLFLSYADTFRRFPRKIQCHLKVELAKMFAEAELNHLND